ncbi:hypothetical protein DPR02_00125 [Burkholderia cepacia]|uniref:O-antigen polysaccharide polymerase Wzy n=1 Tax=Burkholderia cepacia TaxID=292 RepID=A0AAQ0FPS0_BURCE|nr:hypothetical protein [Burkholderia cepacia]RAQ16198.1 hypothetical protein DPR02_00125 [Burkholderia cepacia]
MNFLQSGTVERARSRKPRVVGPTFAVGLLAALVVTLLFTETVHGVILLLDGALLLAIVWIRPRTQNARWFRVFLFFVLGVFPLWQLLAGDEIYLRLLPQDSTAVALWYVLSLAGVLILKLILDVGATRLVEHDWRPEPGGRAGGLAYLFALLSLGALAFMYLKLGGYTRIAELYDARVEQTGTDYDPFRGLGVVQALANTSPLWVFVCLTLRRRRHVVLTVLAFVQLGVLGWLSSGVAGNRQGIVFVLVFALFLYHGFVARIRPGMMRAVGIGVALVGVLLMPLKFGLGYTDVLNLPQRFAEQRGLELSMGPASAFLFRDLSRFDVQTLAIDAVTQPNYEYPMGRSFVGAVASVVPGALWGDRPDTFALEKSAVVRDLERTTLDKTTLLFGMPGEFLVNFGVLGFVLSFAIPAALLVVQNGVGVRSRRWLPLRVVMWPLPFLFFLFDSNVMVYYSMRWILLFGMPMAFVMTWPRRPGAAARVHAAEAN